MTKRARILAAAILSLAALAIVAITSSFGKKEKEIHRIPVNLNETLTNEMSDTSVLDGFDKKVKDYMTYKAKTDTVDPAAAEAEVAG